MEAIYLQSMTDFIESKKPIHAYLQNESFSAIQTHINETYDLFFKYCDFLKQPLQLSFFVPCDENGNVLEEPKRWNDYLEFPDSFDGNKEWGELYNYETAKERVLFKDSVFYETKPHFQTKRILIMLNNKPNFRIYNQFNYSDGRIEKQYFPNNENLNVEYLANFKLELTPTAIKQIGLNYEK